MATSLRLASLASEINAEHEAAERAINDSLQHAKKCGELLIEAKKQIVYGKFGAWVEENFHGSHRLANGYMRIARRWAEIAEDSQTSANLSIDGALALLTTPRAANDSDPITDPEGSAPEVEVEAPKPAPRPTLTPDQKRAAEAVRRSVQRDREATESPAPETPAVSTEPESEPATSTGKDFSSEVGVPTGASGSPDVQAIDAERVKLAPRRRPEISHLMNVIDAATGLSGDASEDEIRAIPFNDLMGKRLRAARAFIDRVLQVHSEKEKSA